MTVAALAFLLTACGTLAAQNAQLPPATKQFCTHTAQVVRIVAGIYVLKPEPIRQSTVDDLNDSGDTLSDDAMTFDRIPAIETSSPDLARAARRTVVNIQTLVNLMEHQSSVADVDRQSGYTLDAAIAMPRDTCRGTAFATAETKTALRHVTQRIVCYNALLVARAVESDSAPVADARDDLIAGSAAFSTAANVSYHLFDENHARDLRELSRRLQSWADASSQTVGELPHVDRVFSLIKKLNACILT